MLGLLFACFARCEYIELSQDMLDNYIGGSKPVLVKFYSPNCPHCQRMAEDFVTAASFFDEVPFAGVNCLEISSACESHGVGGYPTVKLFLAGDKKGIEYEGDRSPDSFADFVQNYTHIKAKRVPPVLIELNPLNFEKKIASETCTFITFYAPWCGHCKKFLPQAKLAAESFVGEDNITIAKLNCDEFSDFCGTQDVHGFPTVKLFKGTVENPIPFNLERTAENVINFVNDHCGSQREVGGLLHSYAGLIPQARTIVQSFLQGKQQQALEEMKALKGADVYVKAMDRFMKMGEAQVKKDLEKMKAMLDARKGSWKALDGLKKRFNVFSQLVPTPVPEIPTETEKKEEL